jgi:hypothetical protein
MNVFRTSCPVVKKTVETFVDYVNVGDERRRVEFTKQIHWIRESESQLLYMHGGQVVETGATHNDFYGFLSSCNMDGPTPQQLATHFSVTTESSLEIVVKTTVFLRPAYESEECAEANRTKPENYKAKYAYVPDTWRKEVVVDDQTVWPTLEREELVTAISWSSKRTEAENAATVAELRRQWSTVAETAAA